MLLVLTNSEDGTSSQLISFRDEAPVFRLNSDLWRHYRVEIRPGAFCITDPIGRTVTHESCAALYVRKPHYFGPTPIGVDEVAEAWARAQVQSSFAALVGWARSSGRLALVDPHDEQRLDKLQQLRVAAHYFEVPETALGWSEIPRISAGSVVAKTLNPSGFRGKRFLFTRAVDPNVLDPAWPWFLQAEQIGTHDITVVYVDGDAFAAELDRSSFEGEDWRRHISEKRPLAWMEHRLSREEQERVRALMRAFGLQFGRLDFIRRSDGTLVFLEVNTNGEWGWLDDGRRGIFQRVWRAIDAIRER